MWIKEKGEGNLEKEEGEGKVWTGEKALSIKRGNDTEK